MKAEACFFKGVEDQLAHGLTYIKGRAIGHCHLGERCCYTNNWYVADGFPTKSSFTVKALEITMPGALYPLV